MFGDYKLAYRLDYEGRPLIGEAVFPSSADIRASFDKDAYKIRDNLNFNLDILNNGKFVQDATINVSVPDLSFTDSKNISLNPGQSTGHPYSILIPATLSSGQHNGLVTAKLGGSQQAKAFSFSVLDLKLDLGLDRTLYATGDVVSVNLENRGGVDSSFEYWVRLIDSKGFTLYQGSTQGLILAGEKRSLDFAISGQATSGTYNLYADVKDLNSGKISHLSKILQVNGLSATLTSGTNKQSYLSSESVTALSSISNQNLAISNGNLNLKVLSGPSREGIQFVRKWGQFGALDLLSGIAVDNSGNVYATDVGNNRVEKFDINGNFISKWGSSGSGDGQFNFPSGIAVDPSGNVYVADTQNNRIQEFDSNGNFLIKWGRYGSLNGQFNNPYDVAVDTNGYVYVADSWNHRIQKFDSNGNFVSAWGSLGFLDGQFYYPFGIAVDRAGYVYVADSNANRIQKFDLNGNSLLKWSVLYPTSVASLRTDTTGYVYVAVTYLNQARIEKYDSNGNFVLSWGSKGQADGQFDMPSGIATDSLGYVYVSESHNRRIQKFDSNGTFVTKWLGLGPGNGNFNQPYGVASDSAGNVYVADRENARTQKFDSNGNFLVTWGTYGEGNGQFIYPSDVAIDSNDNVYVADQSRVQKFDSNGNFISKWGSYGSGAGQFMFPEGIAVDRFGNVYVADTYNHRVQKFDSQGNFLTSWGSWGSLNGQFVSPTGISVDSSGNVYVADTGNNRIQKFDANGNFLLKWGLSQVNTVEVDGFDNVYATADSMALEIASNGTLLTRWGSNGSGDGQFSHPHGMAVDRFGNIYVADTGNNRIEKFSLGTGQRQVVFQKDIPINLSANTVSDITTTIGFLTATGKLYLESTLTSSTGQVVSQDSYPFYIFPSNITMTVSTDKKVYKPGETVNITGELKNLSTLSLLGKNILVTADSVSIYTETINLDPGQSHLFTAMTIASKNFTLEGSFADVNLSDSIEVSAPALDVIVDAPAVVPRTGFDIDTTLKNTSKVEASLLVSYDPFGAVEEVTVPAGETRLIKKTFTIDRDTTVNVNLTGDVTKNVTRQVLLGEKATVDTFPSTIYQEGEVSIPYSVHNTGTLDTTFDATFVLNGQTVQTRTISVSAGARLDDTLYLGNLTKGTYTLSLTSAFGESTKSFKVARFDDIDMQASTTASESQVPVSVTLDNTGFNDFSGTLKAETTFDRKEVEVNLLVNQLNTYTITLNGESAKPGIYDVRASLINSRGNVIKEALKQIEIKAATFEIVSAPTNPSFIIGQTANLPFSIKNAGNVSGKASLTLDLPGVWQETRASWISPGETKEIAFSIPIPDDLEEKDYPATYTLGSQVREFTYHVSGIKLSVDANLNQEVYNPGDTAIFTINVVNQTAVPQNLYAKVQYQDYEEVKHFNLVMANTVSFDILVKAGQQRLSYGVYTESGRAIYLNSTYIKAREDVITLSPDKTLYDAGETVNVNVDTTQSGTLKVIAPNYIEDVPVSGPTSFSFTLPADFRSGTYTIDYSFETTSGSVPIDVKGYSVRVLEASLSKQTYSSQDTIQASLKVASDQVFSGRVKGFVYNEKGGSQQIIDVSRSFVAGENRIQVQGGFITTMPGTHRFVYGIYKEGTTLLLVSGQEAFDVEGASLISLETGRVDYPYIEEPVQVLLSGYGNTTAQLELHLDDSLIHTQSASFSGLTNLAVQVEVVSPGVHTLKAKLLSGALVSEKETKFVFGSSLPDLSSSGITLETTSATDASQVPLKATIHNSGKTDAQNVLVRFYDGNPSQDGVQIGQDVILPIVTANGSATAQVLVDTFTFNGTHTIYVVVDPSNTVIEFNEANNQAALTLTIEKPISINKHVSAKPDPRVLVWTDSKNKALLKSVLDEAGVFNLIVTDKHGENESHKKDKEKKGGEELFLSELRSGKYNQYWIISSEHPLEDHASKELIEKVNMGAGLLVSYNKEEGLIEEKGENVLGIKVEGMLGKDSQTIRLLNSEIAKEGELTVDGKIARVELEGAQAIGTVTIKKDGREAVYPAITLNRYGKGQALYLAFDPLKVDDQDISSLKEILKAAASHLAPIDISTDIYAAVPVEIEIKSTGASSNLKVTEKLPAGAKLIYAKDAFVEGSNIVFTFHLNTNETKVLKYTIQMPGAIGEINLTGEVSYLRQADQTYRVCEETSLKVSATKDISILSEEILAKLDSMNLKGEDREYADKIRKILLNLHLDTTDRKDIEKDIHDLLKAIEKVQEIKADTREVRAMLDRILTITQVEWTGTL